MEKVIVLNNNYEFLSFCDWKRAVVLVYQGKAEPLKLSDRFILNYEKTVKITIPYVIKLVKLIRNVYKKQVPFSKQSVFIRDNYQCQYCGCYPKRPEIEHIIPKSKGGKSTFENCVTACTPCNREKGSRTPKEAGMFLKKQPVRPTINEFMLKKMQTSKGVASLLKELFEDLSQ